MLNGKGVKHRVIGLLFEKHPQRECRMDFVPLKDFLSPFNYGANAIMRARDDWGKDLMTHLLIIVCIFLLYTMN